MARITSLLVFICFVVYLHSCSKKDVSGTTNSSTYYIKFKLNGTETDYNSGAFGSILYSASAGVYTGFIAAYYDVNAGLKNAIAITITSNDPIKVNKAYKDPGKSVQKNGDTTSQVTLNYYDNQAVGYLTLGLFVSPNGTIPVPGAVADGQVTLTEISATDIKGTFSGTIYKSTDGSFQTYLRITDGEFFVKRS
jgi:hypothetical protein